MYDLRTVYMISTQLIKNETIPPIHPAIPPPDYAQLP